MMLPPNQMNISMFSACSTDWTKEFDKLNDDRDGSLVLFGLK